MEPIKNHIEALIFCSENPLNTQDIEECLNQVFEVGTVNSDLIQSAIETLEQQYSGEETSIQLIKSGGGYQFLTKPQYQKSIGILLAQKSKKRLTTSALESLSIIAYRQPISKSEIERIRGVNCDYTIQKLLEKELIEIRGKGEGAGRPLLYGTSEKFMDYFGINSIEELPTLKDFTHEQNSIGKEAEEQSNNRTEEHSNNRTEEHSNNRTEEQENIRTIEQENNRIIEENITPTESGEKPSESL